MKDDEAEQSHTPLLLSKQNQQARDQNRSKRAMQQVMMVMLVEERLFPAERSAQSVSKNTEPIRIRQNSRQGDQAAIPRIIRGLRRNYPTGQ